MSTVHEAVKLISLSLAHKQHNKKPNWWERNQLAIRILIIISEPLVFKKNVTIANHTV